MNLGSIGQFSALTPLKSTQNLGTARQVSAPAETAPEPTDGAVISAPQPARSNWGSKILTGLGLAAATGAAIAGGLTGLAGAAVGALVGAGVGGFVNVVRNLHDGSTSTGFKEGAKAGAVVGAAVGGVIGTVGGLGAVSLGAGAGAVLVGGATLKTIAVFDNYLH